MPYIPQAQRAVVNHHLEELMRDIDLDIEDGDRDGVLNYCVSRLVAGVLKPETGWRYRVLARGIAVLICAGLEFYRRVVAPYEDLAIVKNGDIPEYQVSHDEFLQKAAQACQPPKPTD